MRTQQHSVQGTSRVGTVVWATWLDSVQHVGKKKTRYMWKCNMCTPRVYWATLKLQQRTDGNNLDENNFSSTTFYLSLSVCLHLPILFCTKLKHKRICVKNQITRCLRNLHRLQFWVKQNLPEAEAINHAFSSTFFCKNPGFIFLTMAFRLDAHPAPVSQAGPFRGPLQNVAGLTAESHNAPYGELLSQTDPVHWNARVSTQTGRIPWNNTHMKTNEHLDSYSYVYILCSMDNTGISEWFWT